ncbi:MAG TPA: MFS transporter [Fimbriimonadaceae bacterium]|nr:MFS transporter [Fimbriimonadaceae bacterium]
MATASATISDQPLTPTQKKAFFAAWLGWGFDGLDSYIYSLVALPFVRELLRPGAPLSEIALKAGIIQAVFLVGWAIGGAIFGRVGDRLGRARTLTLTILIYALFTGASFLAQEWWHLLIFRFISSLGIGGEWAAGSALVSETLPRKYKHLSGGVLQNAYIVGIIAAALTVGALGKFSPRWVFLIGMTPALITLWIRRAVPEPEEWQGERTAKEMPTASALFKAPVLSTTLFTMALTTISLTTIWAFLYFNSQVVRAIPEVARLDAAGQADIVRHVTIVWALWNIVGNFAGAALAKVAGYRWAFGLLFAASFLAYFLGFSHTHSLFVTEVWLSAAVFVSSGIFALFPPYIPPLFPVLLRTSGSGLCYNFGRLTAAVGTLFATSLATRAGGPHMAIWYIGFLFLPGIVLAAFVPLHAPD